MEGFLEASRERRELQGAWREGLSESERRQEPRENAHVLFTLQTLGLLGTKLRSTSSSLPCEPTGEIRHIEWSDEEEQEREEELEEQVEAQDMEKRYVLEKGNEVELDEVTYNEKNRAP